MATSPLPNWLVTMLVAFVGLAWILNFLARFVVPAWEPSTTLDGMMTLILTATLGASYVRRRNDG